MQRSLPGGLILRTLSEGCVSDREQLPDFYRRVNGEFDPEEVAQSIAVWTRDLMNDHPTVTLDDIFVIVDPAHDERIVSATLLIPQRWRYEEIPIEVGRPELVGTEAEYRGQGLVRTLFEAVHERSAALGHQLQAITGIEHFYRQFGYTMAVDLGSHAAFALSTIAGPAPEQAPTYSLRPATIADISNISKWYDYTARERLLTEVRSPEQWRYEIVGHNPQSDRARAYLIIAGPDGTGVGYIELANNLNHQHFLYCVAYVIGDQSSYLATFDDVMQGVKQWAQARFGRCPTMITFAPGCHSSLNTLIRRQIGGVVRNQIYKWYLRVPDPIAFLRQIQPVLERRLEGSGAHCYTGELRIGFYDLTGIALTFDKGRIVEIMPVKGKDGYDLSCPWHFFWNVVFGDHTTEEMQAVLPEVLTSSKGAVLIEVLFPKKSSWLEGLA